MVHVRPRSHGPCGPRTTSTEMKTVGKDIIFNNSRQSRNLHFFQLNNFMPIAICNTRSKNSFKKSYIQLETPKQRSFSISSQSDFSSLLSQFSNTNGRFFCINLFRLVNLTVPETGVRGSSPMQYQMMKNRVLKAPQTLEGEIAFSLHYQILPN